MAILNMKHTMKYEPVLIRKTTLEVENESSLLRPISTFVVRWRPLAAEASFTAVKEEARRSNQMICGAVFHLSTKVTSPDRFFYPTNSPKPKDSSLNVTRNWNQQTFDSFS